MLLATAKHLLEELELRTREDGEAQESEQRGEEEAHREGSVSKEFVRGTDGKKVVWEKGRGAAVLRTTPAKMASDWLQHFEFFTLSTSKFLSS